jgi:hypothetical protein
MANILSQDFGSDSEEDFNPAPEIPSDEEDADAKPNKEPAKARKAPAEGDEDNLEDDKNEEEDGDDDDDDDEGDDDEEDEEVCCNASMRAQLSPSWSRLTC